MPVLVQVERALGRNQEMRDSSSSEGGSEGKICSTRAAAQCIPEEKSNGRDIPGGSPYSLPLERPCASFSYEKNVRVLGSGARGSLHPTDFGDSLPKDFIPPCEETVPGRLQRAPHRYALERRYDEEYRQDAFSW